MGLLPAISSIGQRQITLSCRGEDAPQLPARSSHQNASPTGERARRRCRTRVRRRVHTDASREPAAVAGMIARMYVRSAGLGQPPATVDIRV